MRASWNMLRMASRDFASTRPAWASSARKLVRSWGVGGASTGALGSGSGRSLKSVDGTSMSSITAMSTSRPLSVSMITSRMAPS